MIGAIIGDVAGSVYEGRRYKGGDWEAELFTPKSRFTDDTVMTVACSDALADIAGGKEALTAFRDRFQEYGKLYPHAGYGKQFKNWLTADNPQPYGSWGNGAAMRVSSVAWQYERLDEVLLRAKESALVSHDHPEGIKGAQSVAAAIFMARKGASKNEIRDFIQTNFGYDLTRSLARIKENYRWSSACQSSVPEAIVAFLDSEDFESAIRGAIWLGGDADTQGAIAGSIAEAFYGACPEWMTDKARSFLDARLREKFDSWLNSHP